MVLEERKCPNCGSNEIIEKDGTYVCMKCRTFFDNPNDIKITKIIRDETEIERMNRRDKDTKIAFLILGGAIVLWFLGLAVIAIIG